LLIELKHDLSIFFLVCVFPFAVVVVVVIVDIFHLGAIMILSASREFDRNRNPLIIDRPSDNIELPKVCRSYVHIERITVIIDIYRFSYFENS
jgi:hypothetical protein